MRILLTTEGTYPYVRGGVSTWAHSLIGGLSQHHFDVVAVVANPAIRRAYPALANSSLTMVPLWGSELPEEYVRIPRAVRRRLRTSRAAIDRDFLPVLEVLLDEMLVAVSDPQTIADVLVEIARFSVRFDLRAALRDQRAWALMLSRFTANPLYLHTSLNDAVDLARSLFRYLIPLTVPLPEVDVVHSTAAAFCVLPALVDKLERGTALMLSERGVYLRDRILDLVRSRVHTLGKTMFSNLYRGLTHAAYRYADLVVPVCAYNTRWEFELGVPAERTRIIYNGVDPAHFAPGTNKSEGMTVASVGRIDPLKDNLTLIRAVRLVHESMPEVRFRVFGPESDQGYARRCRAAVRDCGLESTFIFEGPTDDVVSAYVNSDLVVLSSQSEGFPFSIVEAMMCGRPIVATAVGGVTEALGDPNLLAPPQNAPALAARIVEQLSRPQQEREVIGASLRQRAQRLFSRDAFLSEYDRLYETIGRQKSTRSLVLAPS